MNRTRSIVDDRHLIRDPWGPGNEDMEIWANTVAKTRIATLFITPEGVRGHAQQIQIEVNRISLSRTEGKSGEKVARAINASKFLRSALLKAIQGKKENPEFHRCPYRTSDDLLSAA